MENKPNRLGSILKAKRAAKGLSLRQAVKLMDGVSVPNLWVLEEGKNTNPTTATLAALSAFYGVSAATLLKAAMEDSK
jgi:transcriptional regulator with XRE-family HTH domain